MPASPPPDPALARLRAAQRMATALLLAAACVYAVARAYEPLHPALGYLRAFCEAAMVGGLADWFAVTALFRHPLRIPLPHTAIIPTNQARIGEALGRFVENNFLSHDVVRAKLAQTDLAMHAARWLADPQRVGPAVDGALRYLPSVLDAVGDEPIREFLRQGLKQGLQRIEMAPLAAALLETLTAGGRHQELVDEAIAQARRLLSESEPAIRTRVRDKTAWLWKKVGVDEAIADRLIGAAEEALAEAAADPTHAWRQRFTELVGEYVVRLRTSEELASRAEALKQALLGHPALTGYVGSLWDEIRARLREDAARDDSSIRADLRKALMRLGETLLEDRAVRETINDGLRGALSDLVEGQRHHVAALIAQTVQRWDTQTLTARIERAIGRDLQYVRINGTLIGGLVGLVIHAVSNAVGA